MIERGKELKGVIKTHQKYEIEWGTTRGSHRTM
jgi:hypothetical protein